MPSELDGIIWSCRGDPIRLFKSATFTSMATRVADHALKKLRSRMLDSDSLLQELWMRLHDFEQKLDNKRQTLMTTSLPDAVIRSVLYFTFLQIIEEGGERKGHYQAKNRHQSKGDAGGPTTQKPPTASQKYLLEFRKHSVDPNSLPTLSESEISSVAKTAFSKLSDNEYKIPLIQIAIWISEVMGAYIQFMDDQRTSDEKHDRNMQAGRWTTRFLERLTVTGHISRELSLKEARDYAERVGQRCQDVVRSIIDDFCETPITSPERQYFVVALVSVANNILQSK